MKLRADDNKKKYILYTVYRIQNYVISDAMSRKNMMVFVSPPSSTCN